MIKSYAKLPVFSEFKSSPVYLGQYNDKHFYAFPEGIKVPSGGKNATDAEISEVTKLSPLIKQVKAEAGNRILDAVPMHKQLNALFDLQRNPENQSALKVLETVEFLRTRSDAIETRILNGEQVDILSNSEWENAG